MPFSQEQHSRECAPEMTENKGLDFGDLDLFVRTDDIVLTIGHDEIPLSNRWSVICFNGNDSMKDGIDRPHAEAGVILSNGITPRRV